MNSDNLKKDNKKIHTQYIKAFYRYLGDYLAPIFKKFNIKANYLTASRIAFILLAAILILFDSTLSKIIVFLSLLLVDICYSKIKIIEEFLNEIKFR